MSTRKRASDVKLAGVELREVRIKRAASRPGRSARPRSPTACSASAPSASSDDGGSPSALAPGALSNDEMARLRGARQPPGHASVQDGAPHHAWEPLWDRAVDPACSAVQGGSYEGAGRESSVVSSSAPNADLRSVMALDSSLVDAAKTRERARTAASAFSCFIVVPQRRDADHVR